MDIFWKILDLISDAGGVVEKVKEIIETISGGGSE